MPINTINYGNPFGTAPNSHPELYINNEPFDGGATLDTEMDGLTVVLTCDVAVTGREQSVSRVRRSRGEGGAAPCAGWPPHGAVPRSARAARPRPRGVVNASG